MSFNLGGGTYVKTDLIVVDRYNYSLVMGSLIGYNGPIELIKKDIQKAGQCNIVGQGYYSTSPKSYIIEKRKSKENDMAHLLFCKKDAVDPTGSGDHVDLYIFLDVESDVDSCLCHQIFNKLSKNTSIPILEEWMPYLLEQCRSHRKIRELTVYSGSEKFDNFKAYCVSGHVSNFIEYIQTGLINSTISINDSTEVSDSMLSVSGLDDYLGTYGDIHAHRIQESFQPYFVPGLDEYSQNLNDFDDYCFYHADVTLYDAQKAVIQANLNAFKDNHKLGFIIGEMGSGKTPMSAAITYLDSKDTNKKNVFVMCPAHLVNKWQREITKFVPGSESYIIKTITDLIAIDSKIKNKSRENMLFIIFSKEDAKFSYDQRPSVIWSESQSNFICPSCGKSLYKEEYQGTGRWRHKVNIALGKRDFVKPVSYNQVCPNNISVIENGVSIDVPCGSTLWSPAQPIEKDWVKLGSEGWVMKRHVDSLYAQYSESSALNRKDSMFFSKLAEVRMNMHNGDKNSHRAVRRYPLSKYIRDRYSGYVHYFIGDELHQYKGESLQGQAFGDLAKVANKVLCLTGTLLNGYADGLFYILYRTMPQVMLKEGYAYNDDAQFMRQYGVIKRTSEFELSHRGDLRQKLKNNEKKLPGVSPLVFTKFLLEYGSFLSLSDMAEGLPPYTETLVPVEMDGELAQSYSELESNLRRAVGGPGGSKILGQLLQTLSVYPDQPFDQPPVISPEDGSTIVTVPHLDKDIQRNKDIRLMEIVNAKITAGERVLIYYHWTNRTDIGARLTNMFSEAGYRSVILDTRVKAETREKWIEDQVASGIQIVICNPALVETGLDLIDFTTIIFYQVGYNIFTLRQSSRRSWRLSQENPVEVLFMYYVNTIQEQALSLMATKLQASMAIEGKFSEEGLRALSNNEDLLTQIANSIVNGIEYSIDAEVFKKNCIDPTTLDFEIDRERRSRFMINRLFFSNMYKPIEIMSKGEVPVVDEIYDLFPSKRKEAAI